MQRDFYIFPFERCRNWISSGVPKPDSSFFSYRWSSPFFVAAPADWGRGSGRICFSFSRSLVTNWQKTEDSRGRGKGVGGGGVVSPLHSTWKERFMVAPGYLEEGLLHSEAGQQNWWAMSSSSSSLRGGSTKKRGAGGGIEVKKESKQRDKKVEEENNQRLWRGREAEDFKLLVQYRSQPPGVSVYWSLLESNSSTAEVKQRPLLNQHILILWSFYLYHSFKINSVF